MYSDLLRLINKIKHFIYHHKLFDGNVHKAGAVGQLTDPPPVSVTDRCCGLGQGRVVLHGDQVGQSWEGGQLPWIWFDLSVNEQMLSRDLIDQMVVICQFY